MQNNHIVFNADYWSHWANSTKECIFIKDMDGFYRGATKAFVELFGYDNIESFLGNTDFDLFSEQKASENIEQDKYVMEQKIDVLSSDWMKFSDNRKLLIETHKVPLSDENGNIIGVQGLMTDVTENYQHQKKIEEQHLQINAIIETIPFPIWLKNADGKNVLVNKAFEDFYDCKRNEILNKNPFDFLLSREIVKPETIEVFRNADNKILKDKIIIHTREKLETFGREHYMEFTKSPVLNYRNEVIGIVGISVDITTHINYQEKLLEARNLAEQGNRAKSEFLANMSHEIRTPMNGVMGFMQLLAETELNAEQRDYVSEALKSSELLLMLINDILDLSKIEAGKMLMERVSFSIRNVIEDVASLAAASAIKKGLEVNALCHFGLPEKVFGDPSKLKQVLNNFVNNAIKFTEKGEITITAKMQGKIDNKAYLQFTVSDTGIGISKENQEKIFEAFTQADTSTTRRYGGTGLGLTICKNIVTMMNGEIKIDSEIGVGSKFSFTAELEIDDEQIEQTTAYKNLVEKKILVVDDNKTNVKIIKHYLDEFSIIPTCSTSPFEALTLAERTQFDMILTDFCMPDMNGVEFAQALHKKFGYENIPIIMLTSRAQRGDYKTAEENNIGGYLSKPIRKLDLIECISMLLDKKPCEKNQPQVITKHTIKEKHLGEKTKILLVEDNPLNQKLTIKMLNKAGFSCDLAQNGKESIEATNRENYDIILMDCQMPVMDGYEATRQLRAKGFSTPIIALTANALSGDMKQCTDAGMDDYLTKPISTEALMNKILKYTEDNTDSCAGDTIDKSDQSNSRCYPIIQAIVNDLGLEKSDAIELLGEFSIEARKQLAEMQGAFKRLSYDELAQTAHSMKGASGNLRINNLFMQTKELEEEAKGLRNREKIEELLNKIENSIKFIS